MRSGQHRTGVRHVWSVAIGILGLALFVFGYWFSYEPAPGVRVRWRDHVTLEQQEALERKYLLVDRVGPHPEAPRSFGYALLDTSRANIEALVKDPAVFDTNDIADKEGEFYVRIGTAYSDRWMWAAHRVPLLRYGAVRWLVILGLAGMAARGATGLWRTHGTDSP